jgi:hypothetical protein
MFHKLGGTPSSGDTVTIFRDLLLLLLLLLLLINFLCQWRQLEIRYLIPVTKVTYKEHKLYT